MADAVDAPQVADKVTYWLQQIEAAQQWHKDWYTEGKEVLDKYMDKKDGGPITAPGNMARMNVLWSNTETIKPALYAKTPTPKVQRRYRDKDPVGRWAAIVLERALTYEFDSEDVDYHVRNAVSDYLLPGRGQCWQYYKPEFRGTGDAKQISWERCYSRHINWKDFLTNPARTWDEVFWVAKRDYLTKEEAEAQGLDTKDLTFAELKDDEKAEVGKEGSKTPKAPIWEIWCETDGLVYFIAKGSPKLLKEPKAPALKFDNFFPVPRPLTTTTTTDSIIPRPDYLQYQPQAREIDRLTQRINLLTKALRVVGIYDSSQEALGKLLDDNTNQNDMIPCDTWAVLAANGGLEGSVDFLPLKDIIQALQQCYISRDQAKQVMYEVTGISDIVRGATDPNETATAQSIKSQWGGLRIRDRQKETQRFVRDILRINAEIIAEHFQLETLKQMSNVPLLTKAEKQQLQMRQQAQQQAQQLIQQNPQAAQQAQQILAQRPDLQKLLTPLTIDEQQALREPTWEEVVALLRDEKLRCMRIDIETDSTINADEAEEKQSRIEFLTAFTGLITTLGPVVMQQPKFAPLFGELAMFGARAFKAADTLESAIEEAVDALSQQALQGPAPPPPDPKMEADKQRMAMEDKHHQEDLAFQAQQHNDQMGLQQQKQATDAAASAGNPEEDMANQQLEMEKIALERERMQFEREKADEDRKFQREQLASDSHVKLQTAKSSTPQISDNAIGPLVEAVEKTLNQIAQQNADSIQEGLARIAEIVSAPKKISIERDRSGKITGGTSQPAQATTLQ